MPLQFADKMQIKKITCTPIYVEPEELREEAKRELKILRNLELSGQRVDDSTIFLDENGSFSHNVIEEGSFKMRTQKASSFMTNFVFSPGYKASPDERLLYSGRGLLLSLLAHAWLWGRPKVLDNKGKLVAFENREVFAPQDILDFLRKIRVCRDSCTYERIRKFLDSLEAIHLHEDTSKWNVMGVIACLRWDKSHNRHYGGPWCSCRLETEHCPPPYHEICLTKSPNLGVVGRFKHFFLRGSKDGKGERFEAEMIKA